VDAHGVDKFDHLWESGARQRVCLGLAGRLIDASCVLISFLQDRFSEVAESILSRSDSNLGSMFWISIDCLILCGTVG
jgi:hypothetical protein